VSAARLALVESESAQQSAAVLRRRDPYTLDRIVAAAGNGYARAGRGKAVAKAHGLSVSRASRYRAGDAGSPLAHALLWLATSPLTTAYPALVEAQALVAQEQVKPMTAEQLVRRRAALMQEKFDLDRDVMLAAYDGDEEVAENAHAKLAALHMEALAITRQLRQATR
jgi:transcriptional regulator with XRE-family HTH domain